MSSFFITEKMTEEKKQTETETVEINPGGISVEYLGDIGHQEEQKPAEGMGELEHLALDPHTVSLERLSTPDISQEPVSEMELLCGNVIKLGEEQSIEIGNLTDIVVEDMKYPKLNQEQMMRLTRARGELKPKIEIMKKGAESGLETCGDIYTEWTRIIQDFFSGDKYRPIHELEIRIAKIGLESLNFSDKGDGRINELLRYIENINEKMVETYRLISREQESKEQEEKPDIKSKPREFKRAYL